ncbi:DUF305 domain-containing protein [Kaistella sp.]|uniref:DUF305 domain-containing protein n=3 Tax=Kaistella sp. TaxID=2782235 RepID=UPI0035A11131
MKKILLPIAFAALIVSCQKTEAAVVETPIDHVDHQHDKIFPVNEMVTLMDDMMVKMHDQTPSRNNNADFATMMIAHHVGAVEMSELLLKKGKDPILKSFAEEVIAAQNTEIEQMKNFQNTREISTDYEKFQQALNQSMAAMMDKNIKVHDDIDKDYAQQMIPHHKSAVEMAEVYLKFGKQPELLKLSKSIVTEQNKEIAELEMWLQKN